MNDSFGIAFVMLEAYQRKNAGQQADTPNRWA
jgi:hypothetical protein